MRRRGNGNLSRDKSWAWPLFGPPGASLGPWRPLPSPPFPSQIIGLWALLSRPSCPPLAYLTECAASMQYYGCTIVFVQILPTLCSATVCGATECKHKFKYRRSRIETVALSKLLHLIELTSCLLCLHRFHCLWCWGGGLLGCFLGHVSKVWELGNASVTQDKLP